MKTNQLKLMLSVILMTIVSGCSSDDDDFIAVTNILLNKTTLALPIGGTEKLIATVIPEDASDKTISWKSSDNAVITVDEKGNVKALGSGTVTITAMAGTKSASCVVTINPDIVQVTSISLNKQTLTLSIDEEETLVAVVSPSNAIDKTVTWSSSDNHIVTVDNTGKIKAISEGDAEITAMAGNQTAVCIVTVSEKGSGSEQTDRFKWALYGMKYAIQASTDYNDLGRRPTSLGTGGCCWIYYNINGSLEFMVVDLFYNLNIKKDMRIPFSIDIGRRPGAMCFASSSSIAANTVTELRDGKYDFENDPAEVLAYFGGYMGRSKFTSLAELRKITNNPDITETVYNDINFVINCYKVIIYDKNKSGKLIGKYAGYVFEGTYIYWNIDPEDNNFGKRFTVSFP